MKKIYSLTLILILFIFIVPIFAEEPEHTLISFDDLAPEGLTTLQCWNALGTDDKDRIYLGFTSKRKDDGREDFAVFRYDPDSGERRFLGSFIEISKAQNNLQPGEEIPKGHTCMIYIDGKMYMGSQGFHDFKKELDDLLNYRGAHLYSYDIAADTMTDISAPLEGGVVLEHQGIVAMTNMPSAGLMVGLAHPHSDLVLFKAGTNEVEKIVAGIPWKLDYPLSREVVATKNGKIYSYRGTENPGHRKQNDSVWEYDVASGTMTETEYTCKGGFWNGQTITSDGNTIYISTVLGELYKLDVQSGAFIHLGHFLPKDEYQSGRRIIYLYGITLSPDESRIYGIPALVATPGKKQHESGNLYAYDLGSSEISFVKNIGPGINTGRDLRDARGNIYFAHFGDEEKQWSGNTGLLIIHVE